MPATEEAVRTDNYSLDVDTPEKVSGVLYHAAESYYESQEDLKGAWQDKKAGKVWGKIAMALEHCAGKIEEIVKRG